MKLAQSWMSLGLVGFALFLWGWVRPQQQYNLEKNNHWSFPKRELKYGVQGADLFAQDPSAIENGEVDLGFLVGHQALTWKRPLDLAGAEALAQVEVIFRLQKNAYLTFFFGRDHLSSLALRLSDNQDFPSALLRVGAQGEQSILQLLPLQNELTRQKLKINVERGQLSLGLIPQKWPQLQGVELGPLTMQAGPNSVWVKYAKICTAKNQCVEENFLAPFSWRSLLQAFGLFLPLALLGVYWSRQKNSPLLLNAVSTLYGLGLLLFIVKDGPRTTRPPYLEHAHESQVYFQKRFDEIKEEAKRSSALKPASEERVLFLGSSQTYGAGAAKSGDTWVERLCQEWRGQYPKLSFTCLNGGIGGSFSGQALELLQKIGLEWKPTLVVVNLGHNDQGHEENFKKNMGQISLLLKQAQLPTVFILEPDNIPHTLGLSAPFAYTENQTWLKAHCAEEKWPCLDLAQALYEERKRGELFWDEIHLSNLGHQIFTQKMLALFPYSFPLGTGRAAIIKIGMSKKALPIQ